MAAVACAKSTQLSKRLVACGDQRGELQRSRSGHGLAFGRVRRQQTSQQGARQEGLRGARSSKSGAGTHGGGNRRCRPSTQPASGERTGDCRPSPPNGSLQLLRGRPLYVRPQSATVVALACNYSCTRLQLQLHSPATTVALRSTRLHPLGNGEGLVRTQPGRSELDGLPTAATPC